MRAGARRRAAPLGSGQDQPRQRDEPAGVVQPVPLTLAQPFAQFEAFVADAEFLGGPLGQDPPGVFLLVQRDVGPSAPGTIMENFTTGAFALVCLDYHPNLDILPDYAPFAVVGPIVVR